MAIPFVDGGRSPGGVDCWGLIYLVYRDMLGIELPSYGEISARDLIRIRRTMNRESAVSTTWVPVQSDPQEFDVVGMRLPDGATFGHVGLVCGPRRVLHIEKASGVAIEDAHSATIRGRIVGHWRHAEK